MIASVFICTRNRADSLRVAIKSIGESVKKAGSSAKIVVVDNSSTDHTAVVVKEAARYNANVRYLHEPKLGVSNARNTAMAKTQDDIILFGDDDMVVEPDWFEKMVTPLVERRAEAVVGTILLGEQLKRPWMEEVHNIWLAATGDIFGENAPEITGGNMGFQRAVLKRVPEFDPELGPGALGFGDDTLFSWQLLGAGYRLHKTPAVSIHNPDRSRLLRTHWLAGARLRGQSSAYLLHHWQHEEVKNPRMQAILFATKLGLRRMLQRPVPMTSEGCASWELSYVHTIEMCRHFTKERERPRNYARHGLVRLDKPSQAGVPMLEPQV